MRQAEMSYDKRVFTKKKERDENWYTYNSSSWVMDRRENKFLTRPQSSFFSVSETMHKYRGRKHKRPESLPLLLPSQSYMNRSPRGKNLVTSIYPWVTLLVVHQSVTNIYCLQELSTEAQRAWTVVHRHCRSSFAEGLISFISYSHTKRVTSH